MMNKLAELEEYFCSFTKEAPRKEESRQTRVYLVNTWKEYFKRWLELVKEIYPINSNFSFDLLNQSYKEKGAKAVELGTHILNTGVYYHEKGLKKESKEQHLHNAFERMKGSLNEVFESSCPDEAKRYLLKPVIDVQLKEEVVILQIVLRGE